MIVAFFHSFRFLVILSNVLKQKLFLSALMGIRNNNRVSFKFEQSGLHFRNVSANKFLGYQLR